MLDNSVLRAPGACTSGRLRRFGLDSRRMGPVRFPELIDFIAVRRVDAMLDIHANSQMV
jgi:hypothetical protein